MIISKTPFRISFFGGGTDFPDYYKKFGGEVLSTSIDKFCYVQLKSLNEIYNYNYRLVWSKNETVKKIESIQNPCIKAALIYKKIKKNIEIHYAADLPKNSGLGTSSSFAVGLLNCINSLNNKKHSMRKLALDAIHIEQKILKEFCGSQDQIQAAHGGFNSIYFKKDDNFTVKKLNINHHITNNLRRNSLLIYTNTQRYSGIIEKKKIKNIYKNEKLYHEIKKLTPLAKNFLINNNIKDFGNLLNEYWYLKTQLSSGVRNKLIDEIYKTSLAAGAYGAKLLGSGGGGFILVLCHPKFQKQLKKKLSKLNVIDFNFCQKGSEIIYSDK